MHQCPNCEYKHNNLYSLRIHCSKKHKLSSKQLYMSLFLSGKQNLCKCGCGEETKFLGISLGFREYKRGHVARVKNNWGHNKRALSKSQDTRRKMFKERKIKPWCKRLTKKMDERVAAFGKKGSITIRSNFEELKRRSNRMRKNRKNGTIPTLSGSQSPSWKGGVAPLSSYCKSYHKLYIKWKLPLLKAVKFRCEECHIPNGKLDIHHDKERFAEILRSIAKKNNWQYYTSLKMKGNNQEVDKLKAKIAEEVANYHIDNKVSGMVLCRACHSNYHHNMNFK